MLVGFRLEPVTGDAGTDSRENSGFNNENCILFRCM